MKSIGSNYPGGHKGSLYSGNTNTNSTNKTDNNKDRCTPLGLDGKLLCPSGSKCPDGYSKVPNDHDFTVCTPVGQGISSGDSYGGYNSSGYPTGSGSGGGYGYSAYYDDEEDRYKYKGEYGVLGELDVKGMTGHGYTPRTQEALAYDSNDNLVPILVSPKRMAVWVNDLKTNPGRFQTTFYDKTMWSRPSYDPYMKRI